MQLSECRECTSIRTRAQCIELVGNTANKDNNAQGRGLVRAGEERRLSRELLKAEKTEQKLKKAQKAQKKL